MKMKINKNLINEKKNVEKDNWSNEWIKQINKNMEMDGWSSKLRANKDKWMTTNREWMSIKKTKSN